MKPKVIVITGYGINSEEETARAFEVSGGEADIVHINDIISGDKKLTDYQIVAFPGGFSYGDDTGSGNAIANKMFNNIQEDILKFAQADKLIIGICNGFQMITNLGLVPAVNGDYGIRQAALMHNSTARYQCRWIWMKNTSQKCIWTKDVEMLHATVAHGEGNFYAEPEVMEKIKSQDQIAFKYVNEDGSPANGIFPVNPNGAMEDIAAVCDPSGRIMGIMPHPERFFTFTNEDGWELKKEKLLRAGLPLPEEGDGLKIFRNGIRYFA